MGYNYASIGSWYAEVHDSFWDHTGEDGYMCWGHLREDGGDRMDFEWPMSMFMDGPVVVGSVSDVLYRWLFDRIISRHGGFWCCLWISEGIYLESGIGDDAIRMGVSRVWHRIGDWGQYQWLKSSGHPWKWDVVFVDPVATSSSPDA